MFKVQVKTNQSWQVSQKQLRPNMWTTVSPKVSSSLRDAQIEAAYLTQEFESYGSLITNFVVDYKILNDKGDVVWQKNEIFNGK